MGDDSVEQKEPVCDGKELDSVDGMDGETARIEGNALFGRGELEAAICVYQKGLSDPSPATTSILHSNIAASYIRLGQWKEAGEAATAAIECGPVNEKALERRAFAHSHIEDKWHDAVNDYLQLQKEFPLRTRYADKALELQQKIDERNARMKEEVMSQLKNLGNMCLKPFGLSTDSFNVTQGADGGYSLSLNNGNTHNS